MTAAENRRCAVCASPAACAACAPGWQALPRAMVCELRLPGAVHVNPTSPPPRGTPHAPATLSLSGAPLAPDTPLTLELQSLSSSGLAVLTGLPGVALDPAVLSAVPEGEVLTFVLERDGARETLPATLVWAEMTDGAGGVPRLELIVDTGEQAGWAALQPATAGE